MKKTFKTPEGEITRDLTQEELEQGAELGNTEYKKELYKQAKKDTIEERVKALEKLIL